MRGEVRLERRSSPASADATITGSTALRSWHATPDWMSQLDAEAQTLGPRTAASAGLRKTVGSNQLSKGEVRLCGKSFTRAGSEVFWFWVLHESKGEVRLSSCTCVLVPVGIGSEFCTNQKAKFAFPFGTATLTTLTHLTSTSKIESGGYQPALQASRIVERLLRRLTPWPRCKSLHFHEQAPASKPPLSPLPDLVQLTTARIMRLGSPTPASSA